LKFCFIICITLVYPILNYPYIVAVEAMIIMSGFSKQSYLYKNSRTIFSIIGFILILILNSIITGINDILNLCGSLGFGSISLVVPAISYLL